MNNPWLDIPLTDYESHISLPAIAQGQMLASQFSDVLQQFMPESVAVVGCAGGNGFDKLPSSVRRVVGVDINSSYIASAAARYLGRVPGLELYVADIQAGPMPFAPVDLIYAALLFEYFSLPAALCNLWSVCRPGGRLVALLQQPSALLHAVSPSPYVSIQTLILLMRLIPPTELADCTSSFGFILESEKRIVLNSGKEFVVQVYWHRSD
jgi:SAM-dependent methyltransferase